MLITAAAAMQCMLRRGDADYEAFFAAVTITPLPRRADVSLRHFRAMRAPATYAPDYTRACRRRFDEVEDVTPQIGFSPLYGSDGFFSRARRAKRRERAAMRYYKELFTENDV